MAAFADLSEVLFRQLIEEGSVELDRPELFGVMHRMHVLEAPERHAEGQLLHLF